MAETDLISRQAAIDALGEKPLAWTEGEYELGLQNQWQSDVDALNGLPSAQPEMIRRSEVVEAIDNIDWYHQNASNEMVIGANPDMHQAWYKAEDVYKALESVPSAQPERMNTGGKHESND